MIKKFIKKVINKIHNNKRISTWTIIITTNENGIISGDTYILECENKNELLETIDYLKKIKQDLDYIRIFPPFSDIPIKEVLEY